MAEPNTNSSKENRPARSITERLSRPPACLGRKPRQWACRPRTSGGGGRPVSTDTQPSHRTKQTQWHRKTTATSMLMSPHVSMWLHATQPRATVWPTYLASDLLYRTQFLKQGSNQSKNEGGQIIKVLLASVTVCQGNAAHRDRSGTKSRWVTVTFTLKLPKAKKVIFWLIHFPTHIKIC